MLRNPALVIGLLGTLMLFVIGLFGTALAPYDPQAPNSIVWRLLPNGNTSPQVPPTLPDPDHWLGTDTLGRDQLSRVLAGAWLTLSVVLAATLVRLGIGVSLGMAGGWYGGPFARSMRVFAAGITALPQLILAIILVLVTRDLGVVGFIASLALVGWPEINEFVSAEVRAAKAQPFMEAARSLGAPGRRLITRHLLAVLGPQLLTVAAMETGAVLLLLAELGLIGLFLGGATTLMGDFGPVGQLLARQPEWGQMLGQIQFFAMTEQLGTLFPALFVVLAAATFALLADGLRAASDPHGARHLLPGTFGLVSKTLVAALCFGSLGFIGSNVQLGPMTMEQGRDLAHKTAQTMWPDSVYVAGVARYTSIAHRMERPEKLTYYYRNRFGEVLRISFVNADRLGVEVRKYEQEDQLDIASLKPLPPGLASYGAVIARAEEVGGAELREEIPGYLVRAIVAWPAGSDVPVYDVRYGQAGEAELAGTVCCVDARTGEGEMQLEVTPPPEDGP